MNLAAMTPQGNLSSTTWALANTAANANSSNEAGAVITYKNWVGTNFNFVIYA
jgi:hypothetical protein